MDSLGPAPAGAGRRRFGRATVRRSTVCRSTVRGSVRRSIVPRLGLSIVRDGDCGVLLQFVEVAVGDNVAWTDPSHLGETGLGNSRRHIAQVSDIVLNYINERCRAVLLNSRRRNLRYTLQRIHQ